MAYAESSIGGSAGGNFRVWVNSIRTYDGSQAENFEEWRVEGGVNRVSTAGGTIYNNYNQASYTVQMGLNGVATSGNFSYTYNTSTGTKSAWGTGTTRVYRDSAGVGFGFTSRTDVNLANSPYLTTGWVQSSDSVQTKYRQATITADSGNINDLTDHWVEFSNPAGATVNAWFEFPSISGTTHCLQKNSIGSRTTWSLTTTERNTLRDVLSNTNSATIRYVIETYVGGSYLYDWRDRTYTIDNTGGSANPTFSDFTYADTNSTTVVVTGNNQALIQGVSTLQATVSTANKATSNKEAEMSSYLFMIGAYSQSSAWSNTVDVVKNIGTVSDVTGTQNLSVRAVDTRGNSTTVTKSVTILPYAAPTPAAGLYVRYTNGFDSSDGITAGSTAGTAIWNVSPLTLSGTDKNTINTTTDVKFDVSKGNNTSYTGTPVNVTITQDTGTGVIRTNYTTLASAILAKMNAVGADNTQYWYIKFQITDKLQTVYYEVAIDIGRPIMRIGTDGNVYFNEVARHSTTSITSSSTPTPVGSAALNQYFISALATNATIGAPSGTPTNGNRLMIRIKDNGTSRTLTWNSIYRVVGAVLPTSTTISKTVYIGCVYNSTDSKWDVVVVNQET